MNGSTGGRTAGGNALPGHTTRKRRLSLAAVCFSLFLGAATAGIATAYAAARKPAGDGKPARNALTGKEIRSGATAPLDIRFVERAREAGLTAPNVSGDPEQIPLVDQNGQGAAFLDADGDGWMDVFIAGGSTLDRWRRGHNPGNVLYRNRKDGTFADATAGSGVRGNAWGNGAAAADYDNDGDVDLFVTTLLGPNQLYRNDGKGRFADAGRTWREEKTRWSSGAAFADFDSDGWLDLYVAHYVKFDPDRMPVAEADGSPCAYKGVKTGCAPWNWEGDEDSIYRNDPERGPVGRRKFTEVTRGSGVEASAGFRGIGVVAGDADGDGDPDVYVGCDVMKNRYFENLGGWKFRERSAELGLDVNAAGKHESGMGVAAGDVNGDGLLDYFTTNFAGEKNTLYVNQGGAFRDASREAGLDSAHINELGWGNGMVDFNGDGALDLFVANGHIYPQVAALNDPSDAYEQPARWYAGDGTGRFQEAASSKNQKNTPVRSARGAAFGDYDNDGDPDVLVVNHNAPPSLFENRSGAARDAVVLSLIGNPSNRDATGAKIEATVGGKRLFRFALPNQGDQSSHDPRIFIGLDGEKSASSIRVRWPSGKESVFKSVKAGFYAAREGEAKLRRLVTPEKSAERH